MTSSSSLPPACQVTVSVTLRIAPSRTWLISSNCELMNDAPAAALASPPPIAIRLASGLSAMPPPVACPSSPVFWPSSPFCASASMLPSDGSSTFSISTFHS